MKLITLIILTALNSPLWANDSITCSTPRGHQAYTILNGSIEVQEGREIASISAMRTKKIGNGLMKIVQYQGNKITLRIGDVKNFDEMNDFVNIRSTLGHEITYPLTCQLN